MNEVELKIEKGIPIPNGGKNSVINLLSKLKVGESILIPDKTSGRLSGYVQWTRRGTGLEFVTRTIKENGKLIGTRIWRTK